MKQNAATWDRAARLVLGVSMLVGAVFAPLPLLARILALAAGGVYMLGTALVGTCLGYKMIGISTCPVEARSKST